MKPHDESVGERLGALFREVHHRVEAAESARISQADMATRLGVSPRAYVDYIRGKGPTGARVALDVLAMLDDTDAIAILRRWREGKQIDGRHADGTATR
ncbi:helix-turn-helix domain-containing protein [Caballeronia zhejiangensis]|uniref:helix-turn-helix domain-containing protein n=1 Tax=Caballeronia zhejiangensis TaxID=871203 RepID=UPI003D314EC0|nr:helix-turn-helix transcriptional regulator [Caballeronia zhejiangensis]